MKFTAVILAGGKGLQLYPLTPRYPKALLPVGNKRMIIYQLEMLERTNNISSSLYRERRRCGPHQRRIAARRRRTR